MSRIEDRLERARRYFRSHHAEVAPDHGFAERVAARLSRPPDVVLGWAAWRLLPASLALALLLAWLAARPAPVSPEAGFTTPSEDPVAWVLGDEEATR